MNNDLLTAKSHAYGQNRDSLNFHPLNVKQEKKGPRSKHHIVNLVKIISGITRGSIMSALLLTVYICNIIYESRDLDIASYTDKNTLNTFSQEVVDVLQTLENKTKKLFNSFQNYYFKSNIDSVIY